MGGNSLLTGDLLEVAIFSFQLTMDNDNPW
jgi:hypothetical protein